MKETTKTHEKTKNWNKKTKPTVPYPTVDGFQSPHTLNTDQGTTSAPRSQLPSTTHLSVKGANQRNYEETCWWNHGRLARKIQCFHSLSSVFGTPLLFLFFSTFRLGNSCFLSSSKKASNLFKLETPRELFLPATLPTLPTNHPIIHRSKTSVYPEQHHSNSPSLQVSRCRHRDNQSPAP